MTPAEEWADLVRDVRAARDAQLESAGEISAIANRLKLGMGPGASASIVNQTSGPILMAGGFLVVIGIGLLAYSLGARAGDKTVLELRAAQVTELTRRVEMLEAYQQSAAKRLNSLEAKER